MLSKKEYRMTVCEGTDGDHHYVDGQCEYCGWVEWKGEKNKWIGKFDVLPLDGKSCVVTDGKHIGYIIFSGEGSGPRFYGDFDSADLTHYMYPEVDGV